MILTGIPSGDHECWCFLVTIGDFQRIKGVMPDEEFDVGPFAKKDSPYRYMIYPSDLIKKKDGEVTTIYVEQDITVPVAEKRVESSPKIVPCPSCGFFHGATECPRGQR